MMWTTGCKLLSKNRTAWEQKILQVGSPCFYIWLFRNSGRLEAIASRLEALRSWALPSSWPWSFSVRLVAHDVVALHGGGQMPDSFALLKNDNDPPWPISHWLLSKASICETWWLQYSRFDNETCQTFWTKSKKTSNLRAMASNLNQNTYFIIFHQIG